MLTEEKLLVEFISKAVSAAVMAVLKVDDESSRDSKEWTYQEKDKKSAKGETAKGDTARTGQHDTYGGKTHDDGDKTTRDETSIGSEGWWQTAWACPKKDEGKASGYGGGWGGGSDTGYQGKCWKSGKTGHKQRECYRTDVSIGAVEK